MIDADRFLAHVARLLLIEMKMLRFILRSAFATFTAGTIVCAEGSARDRDWIEARAAEVAIKPEERKVDQIGWAKDIRDAQRLAKEANRPVFLFTHDGRLNIGRC